MAVMVGEVLEIYMDTTTSMAKVRVGETQIRVPLRLLHNVKVGDQVVIEGGEAVGVVDDRPFG